MFSGPQLEPWTCRAGSGRPQCDQAPTFTYVYMSTDPTKPGFQPYDPANPPSDVAQTTTDQGVTVPFIVRVETGYMDRDQYQISVLYPAGKPWTRGRAPAAVRPQAADHARRLVRGRPPDGHRSGDDRETPPRDYALGKGFVTMSTALDNSGHNCDLAAAGRVPGDGQGARRQVLRHASVHDRHRVLRRVAGRSSGSPTPTPASTRGSCRPARSPMRGAPRRSSSTTTCCSPTSTSPSNGGSAWRGSRRRWATSSAAPTASRTPRSPIRRSSTLPSRPIRARAPPPPTATTRRRTRAAFAARSPTPRSTSSARSRPLCGQPIERKLGRGFVRPPVDNVGVQYGLGALKAGQITPADFVDLNAKAGGADIDTNPDRGPRQQRGLAVAGPGLPQRDDQRGEQPQPDGDHRLPRPQPGPVPRRLSRFRHPRAPRSRARHARQPADLGGPGSARSPTRTASSTASSRWTAG